MSPLTIMNHQPPWTTTQHHQEKPQPWLDLHGACPAGRASSMRSGHPLSRSRPPWTWLGLAVRSFRIHGALMVNQWVHHYVHHDMFTTWLHGHQLMIRINGEILVNYSELIWIDGANCWFIDDAESCGPCLIRGQQWQTDWLAAGWQWFTISVVDDSGWQWPTAIIHCSSKWPIIINNGRKNMR